MGKLTELIDLARERVRAALRAAKLPAEVPRTPREILSLLQSAARGLAAQPPPPPASPAARATSSDPNRDQAAGGDTEPQPPPSVLVPPRPEPTREVSTQTQAELAKFNLAPQAPPPPAELDTPLSRLPEDYGDSRLELLPRDPNWLYAYWELTSEQRARAQERGAVRLGLRLQPIGEDGEPWGAYVEHACPQACRNYFLEAEPDRRYVVELGYWTEDGRWLAMLRSRAVRTPPASVSTSEREVFLDLPFNRDLPPRFTRGVVPALDPELARHIHEASKAAREGAARPDDAARAPRDTGRASVPSSPGGAFSDRPSSRR